MYKEKYDNKDKLLNKGNQHVEMKDRKKILEEIEDYGKRIDYIDYLIYKIKQDDKKDEGEHSGCKRHQ